MRPVAVVGIGKTAFGAFPDRDLRSLAVEAGQKALENGHASASQVEAFYLGNFAGPSFVGQNHLAPYISSAIGINGVPATRFEAACASSGSAFFHAASAVAAGLYDIVLVAGVEKMTSQPTPKVTEILAGAGDLCGEVRAGATFPALFAMIARRHMYQYGTTREQLAAVAVKNHQNGAKNPLAHMRKVITMEQALAGKADRRAAHGLRLFAHQRWRSRGVDHAAGAGAGVHRQAGAGAGHVADVGQRGAGREGRHHNVSRGANIGGEGLQDGGRSSQPISSSPRCTTVLRSPRSSRSKTWGL